MIPVKADRDITDLLELVEPRIDFVGCIAQHELAAAKVNFQQARLALPSLRFA
jgi:hypothetical protein